jgi:hypothetical protein
LENSGATTQIVEKLFQEPLPPLRGRRETFGTDSECGAQATNKQLVRVSGSLGYFGERMESREFAFLHCCPMALAMDRTRQKSSFSIF